MKIYKLLLISLLVCVCWSLAYAEPSESYVFNDFEGTFRDLKTWEFAGRLSGKIQPPPANADARNVLVMKAGHRSFYLEGRAENGVVGEARIPLHRDLGPYDSLRLMMYGRPNTRTRLTLVLSGRDSFAYNVFLTWAGWQQVVVPFVKFKDKRGLALEAQKSYLNSFTLRLLSESRTGAASVIVDNIEFFAGRR